jgi:flagellar biosynthesis protein FlhB
MADKAQRTEEPTQRRIEKARKEGQFPAAKEFIGGLQFLTFVALLAYASGPVYAALRESTRFVLSWSFRSELTAGEVVHLTTMLASRLLGPLAIGGMLVVAIGLAARLATTKMGFSLKKLAPDVKRLDPIKKIQNLPRQNIPSFFQALLMLPVFGVLVYWIVRDNLHAILSLPLLAIEAGILRTRDTVMTLLWQAVVLFMIFGLFDLWRQRRVYRKDLRMSKQELKEEYKETEGDPQIKARVRKLQRDRLRQVMMREVPNATAVIVNPTHFAVAIRYEMERDPAPLVVAKGKNHVALRIKQLALDSQVPVIENPPLARSLYDATEVGQEIPAHLYRAVAEILAYVYRLGRKYKG